MPRRVHDLTMLYRWMRDREVTAREIAEYLGCSDDYARNKVLPSLEYHGLLVVQVGVVPTSRRPAALYAPLVMEREK